MEFSRENVLMADATVIIGLLMLLTFSSISSSFIETQSLEIIPDYERSWVGHYS